MILLIYFNLFYVAFRDLSYDWIIVWMSLGSYVFLNLLRRKFSNIDNYKKRNYHIKTNETVCALNFLSLILLGVLFLVGCLWIPHSNYKYNVVAYVIPVFCFGALTFYYIWMNVKNYEQNPMPCDLKDCIILLLTVFGMHTLGIIGPRFNLNYRYTPLDIYILFRLPYPYYAFETLAILIGIFNFISNYIMYKSK